MSAKKLIVTGDRGWTDGGTIRLLLTQCWDQGYRILVEGECHLGGADILARDIGKELGFEVRGYPAKWKKYGKAAGVLRNQEMLDKEHPDRNGIMISLCLGFHPDIKKSRGTKDMIRRTREIGIPTLLVENNLELWNLNDYK